MARRVAPLVLVALVALVHAGLYAVVVAPWALEDEPQHVDMVWSIGHHHRLPTIEDEIAEPIVRSVWDTDRWGNYGLGAPDERTATAMGLGGRSYLAYHPPGVYLAVAPVAVLAGDDATLAMKLLRVVAMVVAAGVCVLAGVLAGRLSPGRRMHAALVAGVSVALLPAVAESGGRFNTDIVAALVVVAGVLVVRWWADDPSTGASTAVGLALAGAVVVRETTLVLVVPLAVAAVVLHRRGALGRPVLVRCLAIPVGALVLVGAAAWYASGSVLGGAGFLDRYDPGVGDPGPIDAVRQLADRALLPFGYDGWSGMATLLSVVVVVVVGIGLVQAYRAGLRVEVGVALGMLAVQLLLVAQTVVIGLTHLTGRLLLPTYPVLVAVAVAGLVRRRAGAEWAVPAVIGVLAVWFAVVDLVPTYGWPWS